MGARNGAAYLASIREKQPVVYLNGQKVADVTTHPVFTGPLATVMQQYDLQFDPRYQDICLYESPLTGDLVSTSFLIPRSREDVIKRRRHFKIRADHHFGTMGRTPDFMNAQTAGWELADKYYGDANPRLAGNARRYAEFARENDLFLTHVLVNPQIDRSKTSAAQEDPFLHLGKVSENADGIIVRGAKMLGTMAPLTEELLVTPFGGIAPGDDVYALTFALPTNAKGLSFICRESFSGGGRTQFDHPLSSRFEEMDCIAIFDDVLVPWDRVIIDGSPGSGAVFNNTPRDARLGTPVQTTARLLASFELMAGVAVRLADAIGITGFLHIQEKLGRLLTMLEQVQTAFYASDALAVELPDGYWAAWAGGLTPVNLLAGDMHAQFLDIINTLAGGGYFYSPTAADFDNPALRPLIDKYAKGRAGISAEERVKLFKLAWDLAGEGFGQRLRQYVNFYRGDPVRNLAGFYIGYNKDAISAVVDRALSGEPLSMPVPPVELSRTTARRQNTPGLTLSYPAGSHPNAAKT
jgi:anthranilate 3-monooxygenase (FAD)/4-hydroxyphenylacetate 3-monooxygenase